MAPLKVLIIGGGVGGLALAYWLGRLGHNVTVVERYPELRAKGQQIDLRGQGVVVARRMGILEEVRASRVDEKGVMFIDNRARPKAIFPINDTGKGQQAFTSEYEIMRGDLCRILHKTASNSTDKINFIYGTTVDDLEQDEKTNGPVKARLSDGTEALYDLVVGADGQNSRTRRMILGLKKGEPDPTVHSFNVFAAFFAVASSPTDKPLATVHMAPERRMTFTRVDNPRTTQVYYMLHGENPAGPAVAAAVRSRDVEAQRRVFADVFADAGWEGQSARFADALKNRAPEADDFYASEVASVKGRSWSKGRITLLGDAGYSAATLSGFGTSGALIGAYVLAGELASHTSNIKRDDKAEGTDVRAALDEYNAKLRPLIEEAQNIPRWVFKIPLAKSTWQIRLMHMVMGIFTFLRIDKLLQSLKSDDVGTWLLPKYPQLDALDKSAA